MQSTPKKAIEIAERLSIEIIGQNRAIAQVSRCIEKWQDEPTPRFPLRLLFTGPTTVGKQLLASCIADTLFSGRFVLHSWFGIPGPLRLNFDLRTLGNDPLVLFFKMFDHGEKELAPVETLLRAGGIVLGNGRSMSLADSVVILGASHEFSIELAEAARDKPVDGWTRTLKERFPQIANDLDAAIELDPLGPDELVDVVALKARTVSERAGIDISVSDAAARAIAENYAARSIDHALSAEVGKVLINKQVRGMLRAEGRTLFIDYADGQLCTFSVEACAPLRTRSVTVRKLPPMEAEALDGPNFKPEPRPREFLALRWDQKWEFDAFISYKVRKHLYLARRLRNELARLSYNVWLDEDQIGTANDSSHKKTKERLIDHLIRGVRGSHCTIVFEAQLEAVALPPEWSKTDAEASDSVMYSDDGALIAWNWQKLEIDSSSRLIVIRESHPRLSVYDGVYDITRTVLGGENFTSDNMVAGVANAIDYFKEV